MAVNSEIVPFTTTCTGNGQRKTVSLLAGEGEHGDSFKGKCRAQLYEMDILPWISFGGSLFLPIT
jgi:hypothetical protein